MLQTPLPISGTWHCINNLFGDSDNGWCVWFRMITPNPLPPCYAELCLVSAQPPASSAPLFGLSVWILCDGLRLTAVLAPIWPSRCCGGVVEVPLGNHLLCQSLVYGLAKLRVG